MAVRTTKHGAFSGREAGSIESYLGIRYASPPSGHKRFRRPEPVEPHPEIADAREFGPSCPQTEAAPGSLARAGLGMSTQEDHVDEDCLRINVWCPKSALKAPVLVWVHAGVRKGSASAPWYHGAALARQGIVVVTVNHRLGRLGHLYLGGIDPQFEDSGNLGLLDLVEALRWVHENIEEFGGDPDSVTLGGTCGGAAKVFALMTAPVAEGLFHRAVLQSREGGLGISTCELREQTDSVRSLLGAEPGAVDLGQAAATQSLSALLHDEPSVETTFVIDGITLSDRVDRAWIDGTAAKVPLLIGFSNDDAYLLTRGLPWRSIDQSGVATLLELQLGDYASDVVGHYSAKFPDDSARSLYSRILTDCRFAIPALIVAEAAAAAGVPTYMYEFEWGMPLLDSRLRTPHGFDVPFFFGNVDAVPMLQRDSAAEELSSLIQRGLVRFVSAEDPNIGETSWPQFNREHAATMRIGRTPMVSPSTRLSLWDDLWVNVPVMDLLAERPLYSLDRTIEYTAAHGIGRPS